MLDSMLHKKVEEKQVLKQMMKNHHLNGELCMAKLLDQPFFLLRLFQNMGNSQ